VSAHLQRFSTVSQVLVVGGGMEAKMAEKTLVNGSSTRYEGKQSEVAVILGAQWGDEGKGKIVDLLCQRADVVCRCQVRDCVTQVGGKVTATCCFIVTVISQSQTHNNNN